jgi:lipoate-protein ligase B
MHLPASKDVANPCGRRYAVLDLGLVSYRYAMDLQDRLVELPAMGASPDILLLAEHPSTFTVGRFDRPNEFRVSKDWLMAQGLPIYVSDRGGGVVYHGPGQLLVYPILSLRQFGLNVRSYVNNLERVALHLLESFDIQGSRRLGYPGIWVENAKIGFVGLHITRGISKHGLALNVNTDLSYFNYIHCCGIRNLGVTSMARLRGARFDMSLVKQRALTAFADVFRVQVEEANCVGNS